MIRLSDGVKEKFPKARLLLRGDEGLIVRCKCNGGECITPLGGGHDFSIQTVRTRKRVSALLSSKSDSCDNCVGGTK